jgi:hypothetical protein
LGTCSKRKTNGQIIVTGKLATSKVQSYDNGKMRPFITIPGMGGGKESDEEGEFNMIYCKNFCKCHSVFPVQQEYDNKKKE